LYDTSYGASRDHWHQLGNDRITVLAHNGGFVEVLESSRGLQWLVHRDSRRSSTGGGVGIVDEKSGSRRLWSDLYSSVKYQQGYRRIFGTGYFRKTISRHNLIVDHAIFAPFSDDAVVLSEVHITNTSNTSRRFRFHDYWEVNLRSIIASLIYFDGARKRFGGTRLLNLIGCLWKLIRFATRSAPEQLRDSFASKFRFSSRYLPTLNALVLKPVFSRTKPSEMQPSAKNYHPKTLFLALLNNSPRQPANIPALPNARTLCLGVDLELAPTQSESLAFLFGYADEDQVPSIVGKYRAQLAQSSNTEEPLTKGVQLSFPLLRRSAAAWKDSLVDFSVNDRQYSWLTREAKWHSYYLRSATLYDEYFRNHLLPQGGAYNYLQGLQGAPRDFMLFTIPMVYLNPQLARQMLEYTLRLMKPDGRLPYMTHGFGMLGGALVHNKPSDLYLFLLWGLSEYVFATRDFAFLAKRLPFYPKSADLSSTVYQRVKLCIDFLLNQIGIGDHGLLRVGDGDWNDGISTMVRSRGRFLKNGESTFNSAMALYVLPKVVGLVERQKDLPYSERLEAMWRGLRDACLRSWNGKWFVRGWDGAGSAIGADAVFLEPLPWLLLSGILPQSWAARLIKTIAATLDDLAPFGQNLVCPPQNTMLRYFAKGWDINGGIWFAMDALLTWAYGKHNRERAWQSLLKNSLARHAELYPRIWYGIWSGPDAFNASYAARPGETYINFSTPTTDFPVMNLNLHANFLTALLKLTGIEPTVDGLTISPALPFRRFRLRTPVIELRFDENLIEGSYTPQGTGKLTLHIAVPAYWSTRRIQCRIEGKTVAFKLSKQIVEFEPLLHAAGKPFHFTLSAKPSGRQVDAANG